MDWVRGGAMDWGVEEGRWIGESRRGDGLGSRGGAIDWGVEEGHDDK
jgi:hypothetical protein